MTGLIAWRSPVHASLVISLCLFASGFNAQRVVGETLVRYSDSNASSDSRGWNLLSPFRLQQEPADSLPELATGNVVQALATDRPQSSSKARPASAENTVSGLAASLEWPSSEVSIPPEFRRRSSRLKRPGWLKWSPSNEKTKEAKETVSEPQKPQGLHPFSWANLPESEGRDSQVKNVAAESSPGVSQRAISGWSPFSWTNTMESPQESIAANQAPREPTKFEAAASSVLPTREELTNPATWSNELSGPPPRPLEPPVQTSLSEAVQQALKWEDYTDESEKKRLQASRPPKDATVEELIAWEKQKYPWIRPFYWSEDLNAPVSLSEEFNVSTPSSLGQSRAIAITKPFLWTNEESAMALPARKAGDSRTIAFLQGNEELPLPSRAPEQEGSSPDLFDSEGKSKSDSDEGLLGEVSEGEKGAIGEAETLGREPVDNSLQFLRADTVLMDPGQVQYDYGMTYSLFDRSIPFIVTSPSGTSVQLARFRRREMLAPLEIRYGLTRRIQLFLNAPIGWSNTEISLGSLEEFENDGGLGDIIFGGTVLMRQGNHEKSDVIMTLAVTAPTGQDPFGFGGLAPIGPALGGGTWSLASSMLFVRNYDPVVVFYGFGTRQHFLREVNGVNFRPGGEYNYLMGVGFAINERITFSTRFNGAYVSETRLDGERVRGTIQEPIAVGLAMTISKEKRLIEPFVNFGLTDDAADVQFGVTWTR